MRTIISTTTALCALAVMSAGCRDAPSNKSATAQVIGKSPSLALPDTGEVVLVVPGMI